MSRDQLVLHLQRKADEKQKHIMASMYMDAIKSQLPERVFKHIQAVISSQIAACDISIRDHEMALERIDYPIIVGYL